MRGYSLCLDQLTSARTRSVVLTEVEGDPYRWTENSNYTVYLQPLLLV